MTFRSRLFATVALPVLSVSLVATPTLADALMKPFEVAQESSGQPTEEELLLLQQQQEEQRRAAEEEAQRQAAEQQRAAEEEAQRQAEQQKAAEEEAQRAAEEQQRQAEEQQRAAEEEAQRQAEQQKAAEEEAQRAAEEQQRAAEEEAQRQAEQQKAAEEEAQRAAEEQQKAADEEAQRQAEQQKAAEEEAQRAAEEQQRQADEQKAAEEQQQQQQQTEEQPQQPAEEQQAEQPVQEQQGEQPAVTEEQGEQPAQEQQAEQPAQEQGEQPAVTEEQTPAETGTEQQPSTAETGETLPVPVPEVVDTLTEEQKQEIAADPEKTDETVVLPVENGAAVLDSDKDADNLGGQTSREERRKQREELRAQEEIPLPESDVSAQAAISEEVREAVPQKIEAAIKEEGQRLDAAPAFEVPQTTNITVVNNTIINNNTVNNTVNNNTVNNNVVNNNITQINVVEKIENRTVLSVGDRLFVRGDDRPRLRRDSEEVYYDNLARGRTRETIVRPGGVQIVTIYNRYGDIIQRSRVGRDGREYILVYAPEREDDAPRPDFVDVGYELPPMRLRIPLRDYIVDTSSDPDRDYYDFLSEPPVERVERVYTIDEVKHSARLRDKVRRIDLDTITFATASAEVPMSQARTLRKVAEAMEKVLDKDPGETFLIEGHTDAVGSDKSNLVLSDERAEAVASMLTEVYGIPPENLQTQGYGERFLKVRTQSAEQQNRRVTIRRVTTLVRPVASAN